MKKIITFAVALTLASAASAQIIKTVAGDSAAGYSGNGGQATAAELNVPNDLAMDASGNMYIADYQNNVVRKVNGSSGIITTVAGNGAAGFFGDGGQATNAEFSGAIGVGLDNRGNLYICDLSNSRVREVSLASGLITTCAGNGVAGYKGDGGPATLAELKVPYTVAIDTSRNIFIADAGNNVIRKVNPISGFITTVVGDSVAGFSGDGGLANLAELSSPYWVRVDESDNIYIADNQNHVIRKVSSATDIITTIAGIGGTSGYSGDGGIATAAELHYPNGVEVDNAGNVYIGDFGNERVRKIDAISGKISTIAGMDTVGYSGDGGPATAAELDGPAGVALDAAGNVYVADAFNSRIRKISSTTGIEQINSSNGNISVYPNPTNGKITFTMSNYVSGSVKVEVYNLLGEQVYSNSYQLSANGYQPKTIDLSSNPDGIYLYKVMTNSGELIGEGKLVIQK